NVLSPEDGPRIDSILMAPNRSDANRHQATFNINYAFESGKNRLNIDLDYGKFKNDPEHFQPNYYFNATETEITSQFINRYYSPNEIDISTAKADYETEVLGGSLGIGAKF